MSSWRFFGRERERADLARIFARERFFFVRISGRRRIGKTTLIRLALQQSNRAGFYLLIPDADETGVMLDTAAALEVSGIPPEEVPRPRNGVEFVQTIETLVRSGRVVVLDEFQHLSDNRFAGWQSRLQKMVDDLQAEAGSIAGGLVVLGSVHAEMVALLEDRAAPLYGRVTNPIDLPHLDLPGVLAILREYADDSPERLLFLWTLFQGVPKYYRDAHEEEVLSAERPELLRRMFFDSSAPLRTEVDATLPRELKGRNNAILRIVAEHQGASLEDIREILRQATAEPIENFDVYLAQLRDTYQLVERRQPIFSGEKARRGRYYLADNFLICWFGAIARSVAQRGFHDEDRLIAACDERLKGLEGFAFERLVATLYEERSRRGMGDFPLGRPVHGYWRKNIEIDLVMVDEDSRTMRLATCKRSARKLVGDVGNFNGHVERLLEAEPRFGDWTVEKFAIAPRIEATERETLSRHGLTPQDLPELTADLTDPNAEHPRLF